MRFTVELVDKGFLAILRVEAIKFLVGEYAGDGGRGILLRTFVFILGDGGTSREPNWFPPAPELEFINVKGCGKADDILELGSCRGSPPLRSLSNLAFKSLTAVEVASSRLVGLEELGRIEPFGVTSITSKQVFHLIADRL